MQLKFSIINIYLDRVYWIFYVVNWYDLKKNGKKKKKELRFIYLARDYFLSSLLSSSVWLWSEHDIEEDPELLLWLALSPKPLEYGSSYLIAFSLVSEWLSLWTIILGWLTSVLSRGNLCWWGFWVLSLAWLVITARACLGI